MLNRTVWKQETLPDEPLGTARTIGSLAPPTARGLYAVTPGAFIDEW